jgi:hypothetical protein
MNYEEIKDKIRNEVENLEEEVKNSFYREFKDGEIFAYKQILLWLELVELSS